MFAYVHAHCVCMYYISLGKHLRLENPVQESWKKKNNAEFMDPRLTTQYERHSSLTTDAANSDNHNQLFSVSSGR